jgi:hypothetical protein
LVIRQHFVNLNYNENIGVKEMSDYSNLKQSVDELTSVMIVHAKYLEQHRAAMENLARAVKELQSTMSKDVRPQIGPPSLQLKQVVTTFMENYVNPRYYKQVQLVKVKR